MPDLDFYTHFVTRGEVLGAGIGSEPAQWEAKLGSDYLDDRSERLMRRDYGLLELSFQEEESGVWACFGIAVQVHRLHREGTSAVPAPLLSTYGTFPSQVRFDELVPLITGLGYSIEPDNDDTTTEIHRYRVVESGARIFVIATTDERGARRAGDLYRLSVSPIWWHETN